MENELIYLIGDALIMEIEEIKDITYPKDFELNSLKIVTYSDKHYQLVLRAID